MNYANRASRFALYAFLAALLLPLNGTGETKAEQGEKGLEIVILCFSGRPELRFILHEEQEIERLKALMKDSEAIQDFKEKTVLPAMLGYHGVEIENPDSLFGFPRYIAAYKGTVETLNGQRAVYRDKNAAIEKYIVELAYQKKIISKNIHDMLFEDIEEN